MKSPPLRSFQVENFKAIRDSGSVDFGWLTVFIGNNGVGKSSLIEALETFRDVVLDGVDAAFSRWRGFEHALNKASDRKLLKRAGHREGFSAPMKFRIERKGFVKQVKFTQSITQGPGGNTLFIQNEQLIETRSGRVERWTRNDRGNVSLQGQRTTEDGSEEIEHKVLADGESMLKHFSSLQPIGKWQFLMLNPDRMGLPTPQQRAANGIRLAKDGANIAEYLHDMRKLDLDAFEGLLEAVRFVLPYATDLQPHLASELERAFYLKLREEQFDVPGWLLSTGTLRIVALLACLRHPKPPPLLVVEEIENGLDPRTLHMVVEEIRATIARGKTQVILTTHSPYLLDLLDLSHIVVVEREAGQPTFTRPDEDALAEWSKSFSPGRLYTMGNLTRGES